LKGDVPVEARYTLETDDEQARWSRPLLSTNREFLARRVDPQLAADEDRTCRGPTTSANWQSGAAIGA
jgi:hypothetical protein